MRTRTSLLIVAAIAIAGVTTPTSSGSPPPEQHVLVGRISYVQSKGKEEFEQDRAFSVHENTQYVVVSIERPTMGTMSGQAVVVGVRIDVPRSLRVNWFSSSYGVLDPDEWKRGVLVVVFASPSEPPPGGCLPEGWAATVPTKDSAAMSQGVRSPYYIDEGLQRFRGSQVHCASVGDILFVRE